MTVPRSGVPAGDGDAAAAPELEELFVAGHAEGSENGVGVDIEDAGEVYGGREARAGFPLAECDRASDLAGDLGRWGRRRRQVGRRCWRCPRWTWR